MLMLIKATSKESSAMISNANTKHCYKIQKTRRNQSQKSAEGKSHGVVLLVAMAQRLAAKKKKYQMYRQRQYYIFSLFLFFLEKIYVKLFMYT